MIITRASLSVVTAVLGLSLVFSGHQETHFSNNQKFANSDLTTEVKVWALGDGEKVFRDDLNHDAKEGNKVWDGDKIRLQGLYNEVLAFQVIVEAGEEGANAVEVLVDGPVHSSSGKGIGNNTLKHGPGGTIEVFTQHYLHVTDPTAPNWFYGSSKAAPKQMIGWIPDALIPTNAFTGSGGFPVDVGSNRNQGFWVDISLPRDQERFPQGVYRGSVQVLEEGKVISEIPLEVEVLPYYLSDTNVSTIWVNTSENDKYYPEMTQKQVDNMIKFEGQRHRINVTGGSDVNRSSFNNEAMEEYKPYLDGTAYTPANGYHGPGEGIGEKIFPIGMYGADIMGSNKEEVQQQSNLWVKWFQKNAPDVTYFWYLIDEPSEDKYDWIKERARWVKSNPNSGKSLPIFTTEHYNPDLEGAIDIWAAFDGVNLDALPKIRNNGGDHWFYNGNRPRYGSVILEGAAVDLRVNSWIMYKYDIDTHFIWRGAHWQHNLLGPKRFLHQNIFKNPLTFINDDGDFGNGDGILFYPGRMPFYPEEDRGLNKVLPSIRLKNIRRGQQDAVLMKMVEENVGREKVLEIINDAVPKAMSEVSMDEPVPWSEEGKYYIEARRKLLENL